MRYLLLVIFIQYSTLIHADDAWFQHDSSKNTYLIDAKNIHPAAFFKQFSLSSGIEILYDKNIDNPIEYYSNNGKQSEIISYLKKKYSTLLTYEQSKDNNEYLTGISILPKGLFQSSNMIIAIDPVEESINFKKNLLSSSSEPVYLTRLDNLKSKIRLSIELQADRTIIKRNAREKRTEHLHKQRSTHENERSSDLGLLKHKDPALYAAQKSIFEGR